MITLGEYILYKYKAKTITITEDETTAFGIPYPVQHNWFVEYSDARMSEEAMKELFRVTYWKSKILSGRYKGELSSSAKISLRTLDTLKELFGATGIFDFVPTRLTDKPMPTLQKKLTASEKRKAKREKRKEIASNQRLNPVPKKKKKPVKQSTVGGVSHIISKCRTDATSDAFLSTFEWRALRMQALTLHGAKCQCCGATPAIGAVMHVDHIKPRKFFPTLALNLDNLQILCEVCNHGKGNWNHVDWRAKE